MLSIMIVTRNRKEELLRNLHSCIECSLPDQTEFVIVDNASQDCTKEAVDHFFQTNSLDFQYHYLPENVGAAAGRNEGLRRSKGRYIYFSEDDAYIQSPKENFFEKMLNVLVENENVFCITTSIYDTECGPRPCIVSRKHYQGTYNKAMMFHGGSFFVDRQRLFDHNKLFLNHQFRGMAELYPSLKGYFNNKFIIEMNDNQIIHEPSLKTRMGKKMELMNHFIGSVHGRLAFYPIITYPILYTMFCVRVIKHLGYRALPEAFTKLAQINTNLVKETVTLDKFTGFLDEFGFIATF